MPATIVIPRKPLTDDNEGGVAVTDNDWMCIERGAYETSFDNCNPRAQWVFIKLTDGRKPTVGLALLSPLSPTTLPHDARRMLGISENAQEYAFLAPCLHRRPFGSSSGSLSERSKARGRRSAEKLIDKGGFVYFNESGTVQHINAISDNQSGWRMEFYPAKPLRSKPVVGILAKQGRLSKVTIKSLLDGGATHFAWIHAREFDKEEDGFLREACGGSFYGEGERLKDYIGEKEVLNGGFLYTDYDPCSGRTHEGSRALYLAIAPSEKRAPERTAAVLEAARRSGAHKQRSGDMDWAGALNQAVVENNQQCVRDLFGVSGAEALAWPHDEAAKESLLHIAARLGHGALLCDLLDRSRALARWADERALAMSASLLPADGLACSSASLPFFGRLQRLRKQTAIAMSDGRRAKRPRRAHATMAGTKRSAR